MTKIIDGFELDVPLIETQVIALAQYHHKQIDEAIFHQEVHLGEYGLKKQFQVEDSVRDLSDEDRKKFYQIYNKELSRLAVGDDHHAFDEPETGNLGLIITVLAILAIVIYFLFVRPIIG